MLPKNNVIQSYPLRFILMFCGLGAACPIVFLVAHNCNIPFYLLMIALFIPVCIIPFFDFIKSPRANVYYGLFRLLIAFIIGFGVFLYMPLLVRIVVTVFVFILLSVLASVMVDRQEFIAAFCGISLVISFFLGFLIYRGLSFTENEQLLNIIIAVSIFSSVSFFLITNVTTVRWFSIYCLSVPRSMKRASVILLSVVCVLIAVVTLSSWIFSAVEALINGIINVIRAIAEFINNMLDTMAVEQPAGVGAPELPPILDTPVEEGRESIFLIILNWIVGILTICGFLFLLYTLIKKIARFFIWLFRGRQSNNVTLESEVFTEVIEKIAPDLKKRAARRFNRQPRYSSLLTERERILYIYNEYVKRAKRRGFTRDGFSDTPNEVLDEVAQSIGDGEEAFPLPDGLGAVYNAVRYGDVDVTGANELKQRLL